ncbi:hypothetical protein [Enterobacter asburiae]|uniref:hypothetical protein n=1 Tax=Enterobacter asburiae TaxID=61645 RepID=UPI00210BAEE0|nr:hypothetical protein [Enterobacter asburiae]MCQ4369974.1 hypothetical protein [Enterobacter asburiae]HDC4619834.1 hypothetical protein [Enterobacter asburiae]
MTKRNLRETTQSPELEDESASGGVSTRLLEQLNSEKLDHISSVVTKIEEHANVNSSQANPQGGGMTTSFQSFIKWAGLSLPLVVAIAGSVAWINSTIESKARENRLEMKAELQSVKIELKGDTARVQDSVGHLEDKIDRKMDKVSDQLTAIQQEIRESKK